MLPRVPSPSTGTLEALNKLGEMLAETTWRAGAQVLETPKGNAKVYSYAPPEGETEIPVHLQQQLDLRRRAACACVRNELLIHGVPLHDADTLSQRVTHLCTLRFFIASAGKPEQRLRLAPQILAACGVSVPLVSGDVPDLSVVGNSTRSEWIRDVASFACKIPGIFAHTQMRLEYIERTHCVDKAAAMRRADVERAERKRELAESEEKQNKLREEGMKRMRCETERAMQAQSETFRGALAEETSQRLRDNASTAASLCTANRLFAHHSSQLGELHTAHVTTGARLTTHEGVQADHTARHDRTERAVQETSTRQDRTDRAVEKLAKQKRNFSAEELEIVGNIVNEKVEEQLQMRLGTPDRTPVSSSSTTPVLSVASPFGYLTYASPQPRSYSNYGQGLI